MHNRLPDGNPNPYQLLSTRKRLFLYFPNKEPTLVPVGALSPAKSIPTHQQEIRERKARGPAKKVPLNTCNEIQSTPVTR